MNEGTPVFPANDLLLRGTTMSTWERKLNGGAQRLGCMTCGAHVLVVGERSAVCQCCGEHDLRPVLIADEHQHLIEDPRQRFLRQWSDAASVHAPFAA